MHYRIQCWIWLNFDISNNMDTSKFMVHRWPTTVSLGTLTSIFQILTHLGSFDLVWIKLSLWGLTVCWNTFMVILHWPWPYQTPRYPAWRNQLLRSPPSPRGSSPSTRGLQRRLTKNQLLHEEKLLVYCNCVRIQGLHLSSETLDSFISHLVIVWYVCNAWLFPKYTSA